MSQIKLVALRRHPFGVGHRDSGEEYFANPDEARILKALGWAREADAPKPEPEVQVEPPVKSATKQVYRTRDMKAKE